MADESKYDAFWYARLSIREVVTFGDCLLGGGSTSINVIPGKVVDEIVDKLFK